MGKTSRAAVAVLAVTALGLTFPAGAQETSTDVLLVTVAGSRTLNVTTPAGANLDGGEVDLGTAHTGAFVVSVADVNYEHVGYQVSSTLSNLYLDSGGPNCAKRVDSGDLAVSFPIDTQLQGLGALLEGLIDLEGTVSGGLVALLDPLGLVDAALGAAGQDPLSGRTLAAVSDVATQLEDTLNQVLDGLDPLLPVKVGNGNPGPYTAPAAHPTCAQGAGSPTSKLLLQGDASSLGDFVAGLISDLEDLVNGVTASDLVDNGVIDAAAAQAAAAEAIQNLEDEINAVLPVDVALPQTPAVINAVLDLLLGTLDLTNLVGQTGVGIGVPALDADPASAPQSGVYRGRMTVTLIDVP
jgi:hypothetical protein